MTGRKVRIGIIGVGNCASSLVQGLTYYRDADGNEPVPGLMHVNLGGYHVSDIVIAAAFDVAATKVGLDVAEAIYAEPNNTHVFAKVEPLGVKVQRGRTLDGIGKYLKDMIDQADVPEADIAGELRRAEVDVLVSYLPVGSELATQFYAEQALKAGCGFVNCIPSFIASHPEWEQRFAAAGLPIVGDDIKSQVGATIIHRA
ncbi:MAG: Myo-inositol-phosphate synthase, partial [Devosia sp.]|nr:Myo-inositol-phosphate synthase [Devosia sp.]